MKTKRQILMLLLVLWGGVVSLSGQNKKEKKEAKKEAVREVIISANYKINVGTALPMSGRSIVLITPYSLEVKNDSVFSYLPYYGRAYNIPYGGGKGLIFDAPIEDYQMNINQKGNAVIEFSTRSSEDYYKFIIRVYGNGSATINVTMQNRQSIGFRGEIEVDD